MNTVQQYSLSEQPLIAHDKELSIQHIKVEPDGMKYSEEQPLAHQPHDTEFVSEKIKLEKQETEENDVIDDQPLALRIHDTHGSKNKDHKQSESQNKRYGTHRCSFCRQSFTTSHLLTAHKKTHTLDKPFKCAGCEKCFFNSKSLETHIKLLCITSNKKKLFQLNKFTSRKYKAAFLPLQNPFKCAKCSRCFSQRNILNKHIKTICKPDHKKIKPFKCAGCARCFALMGPLQKHVATQCNQKSVRTLPSLINHPLNDPGASNTWVIDAGDRPYTCSGCGIAYSRALFLKKHVKSCKKLQKLNMLNPIQNETNPINWNSMLNEIQNEINPINLHNLNPIQNEINPIHLNMLNPINLNIGEPNPNNSHECAGCGKSFPKRRSMLRHVQRYTARTKPFQCASCGQYFSQKCTLKKHKKTHIVEKAHKCNRCEKSFVHETKLFIHMSIHTEEETREELYNCNECGIHFSHSNILEHHMKTHLGQNHPYYLEQHEFEQDVSNSTYLYTNQYNSEQHYLEHDGPSGQPLEVLINEEKPTTVNIKSEQDDIEVIDICEEDPIDILTAETEDVNLEQEESEPYERPLEMLIFENKPFNANFTFDHQESEEYLLGD